MANENDLTKVISFDVTVPAEPSGRSAQVQAAAVDQGSNDQAAPEAIDLGAIPGTETGTETPDLRTIPMTEVKPEDIGTLSLRYTDGVPVLVVSGGTAIPAGLTVVDASGKAVAVYTVGPIAKASARSSKEEAVQILIILSGLGA